MRPKAATTASNAPSAAPLSSMSRRSNAMGAAPGAPARSRARAIITSEMVHARDGAGRHHEARGVPGAHARARRDVEHALAEAQLRALHARARQALEQRDPVAIIRVGGGVPAVALDAA